MTEKGTRKSKDPRTKKSAIKKISSSRRQLDHYLIFTIKPWNGRRRRKGQKTPRNKVEAHTFVIPLPTFTRNDAASILKKSKKKKKKWEQNGGRVSWSQWMRPWLPRPTLCNPSLHSVASKSVPFHPARALASTTKRAPKQTGISMVTRNYQGWPTTNYPAFEFPPWRTSIAKQIGQGASKSNAARGGERVGPLLEERTQRERQYAVNSRGDHAWPSFDLFPCCGSLRASFLWIMFMGGWCRVAIPRLASPHR